MLRQAIRKFSSQAAAAAERQPNTVGMEHFKPQKQWQVEQPLNFMPTKPAVSRHGGWEIAEVPIKPLLYVLAVAWTWNEIRMQLEAGPYLAPFVVGTDRALTMPHWQLWQSHSIFDWNNKAPLYMELLEAKLFPENAQKVDPFVEVAAYNYAFVDDSTTDITPFSVETVEHTKPAFIKAMTRISEEQEAKLQELLNEGAAI